MKKSMDLQRVEKVPLFVFVILVNDVFRRNGEHVYSPSKYEVYLSKFRQEHCTKSCPTDSLNYSQNFSFSIEITETSFRLALYSFFAVNNTSREFETSLSVSFSALFIIKNTVD